MEPKTTIENVTADQIRGLLAEAKAAGDADAAYVCRAALNLACNRAACMRARARCVEMINDAEAMRDDEVAS